MSRSSSTAWPATAPVECSRGQSRSPIPSSPWTWRAGASRLEQRPVGAPGHRHVRGAGDVEHGQGVVDDLVDIGVAGDAGDRPQVQPRVAGREEQRAGVVDAGVDIEDDGDRGPGAVVTA